jgi:hypothetical protein
MANAQPKRRAPRVLTPAQVRLMNEQVAPRVSRL